MAVFDFTVHDIARPEMSGHENHIWEVFGRELLNRKFEWAFIEVLRSLGWRASESRQMGIYAV